MYAQLVYLETEFCVSSNSSLIMNSKPKLKHKFSAMLPFYIDTKKITLIKISYTQKIYHHSKLQNHTISAA
jgi:hypothetical protein